MKNAIVIALALGLAAPVYARDLGSVQIKSYDCTLDAMKANQGKCELEVESQGERLKLTASPEVGAPWGTSYGPEACRPMEKLSMTISEKGEILTVKDSVGKIVSTKYNYNR